MAGYDGATSALIAVTIGSALGPVTGRTDLTGRVTDRATGAELDPALPLSEWPDNSGVYVGSLPALVSAGVHRAGVEVNVDGVLVRAIAWLASPFGCTRRDLRIRLARRLAADEWVWQVRAESGDAGSAIVPDMAIGGGQEYRGLWVSFPDRPIGAGERRVTDFAATPPTIEWAPAVVPDVAPGDLVELLPQRPSRLNEAIADALRLLDDALLIDAEEACITTDGVTGRFLLPADARQVVAVGLEPIGSDPVLGVDRTWLAPDAWALEPGGYLRIVEGGGYSVFYGHAHQAIASGWVVRLRLRCRPPRPVHDLVWLPVLPEAIVDAAAEQLALSLPEYRTLLPTFAQRATQSRLRATSGPPGGAVDVPD